MESYNSVAICSVDENFSVAVTSLWSRFVVLPFKRLEFLMISKNIFSSECGFSGFFVIPTASVLKRSEYSGWYIDVVHLCGSSSKKSV
jgi:hypothetical protein